MKIEVVYKREGMRGYKTAIFLQPVEAIAFLSINAPVEIHAIRVTEGK